MDSSKKTPLTKKELNWISWMLHDSEVYFTQKYPQEARSGIFKNREPAHSGYQEGVGILNEQIKKYMEERGVTMDDINQFNAHTNGVNSKSQIDESDGKGSSFTKSDSDAKPTSSLLDKTELNQQQEQQFDITEQNSSNGSEKESSKTIIFKL